MAGEAMAKAIGEQGIDGVWDFYAYLFDQHPEVRDYFKGHENMTGVEIKKSDYFKGQAIGLHKTFNDLARKYEDKEAFRVYVDDIVDRHMRKKIMFDKSLWKAFWQILINFLETKGPVDDATKKAVLQIGNDFAEECWSRLEATGH